MRGHIKNKEKREWKVKEEKMESLECETCF